MSRRTRSENNKKPCKKLSDNSNFEFYVETVQSLTPDSRSVEPSPAKKALDSAPTNQMKTRSRRTEPLNALKDSVEFKSERKTKSSSKVKKKKQKQPSKLSASIVDNQMGLSGKTPEGKENNLSASGLATRSTRSRTTLLAVQDNTISTLSVTSELNDSCSFVTLRKNKTPKEKSDQNSTLEKTPVKSGVESASKPSNKSTGGINNLTYTPPSPEAQNNDTHSNYFNVLNKDVFDLVSKTPSQELGNFMLDGGESVLLSDTLYKKMSVAPRLTRTGTFTVTEPVHTPKAQPTRKSRRKRWSQGEKTPIFGKNAPNKDLKETSPYKLVLDSQRASTLLKVSQVAVEANQGHPSIFNNTLKADKSVSFFIPSPRVSVSRKESKKSSTNLEQEALPSCSNTQRSSECSVIVLDSTKSERSMVRRAPSSKRSSLTKTPLKAVKTLEDSVIILDSTKSERSMSEGAHLTHKSAMKSTQENKQTKQKKSVKLTSPEFTPRSKKLPPLPVRKTPLLKTVFNGDNSILAANCVASKVYTGPAASSTPFRFESKDKTNLKAKPSSRVKLPDFKKIHERQFEKMEDIKQHQERKAARAQLLISGTKSNSSKVPDLSERESKRKLIFSPAIQKTLPKSEQERAIKRASLERQVMEKKQKLLGSKVPKLVLSKPQQLLINKRNSLEKKNNSTMNKSEIRTAAGKNKMLRKKEEIKSVATKSKAGSNFSDRNRSQVVNVRTNRRFELLMKMREKEGKKS